MVVRVLEKHELDREQDLLANIGQHEAFPDGTGLIEMGCLFPKFTRSMGEISEFYSIEGVGKILIIPFNAFI